MSHKRKDKEKGVSIQFSIHPKYDFGSSPWFLREKHKDHQNFLLSMRKDTKLILEIINHFEIITSSLLYFEHFV